MNPSSEVGNASGEETGIEETMEAVVTTMDAMLMAVDAVEAMVMAVEMREWLEVGRPETERSTAVRFFSHALSVEMAEGGYILRVPRYWPGEMPGLVPLLADCLLPHNSTTIQSDAMQSIKYLLLFHEIVVRKIGPVSRPLSDHLFRLVRDSDSIQIRNQGILLLAGILHYGNEYPTWFPDFHLLINDLVGKYAAILEPTEGDISSLHAAVKALALTESRGRLTNQEMQELLPVLIGIVQEPGKWKKTAFWAAKLLMEVTSEYRSILLESGAIGTLLGTLRAGKAPKPVLIKALQAIAIFVNSDDEVLEKLLDMGALEVYHLVLKRPNDRFRDWESQELGDFPLWVGAIQCLNEPIQTVRVRHNYVEAVLCQEGLLELVLDLALGMDISAETWKHHYYTLLLLANLARRWSKSQMRRLMSKGPLFPLLSRYLTSHHFDMGKRKEASLRVVKAACEAMSSSEADQRLLRRLLDDHTGITDAVRSISIAVNSPCYDKPLACQIRDTYLNNPLPPLPPTKLPLIIYTRNSPS